MSSKEEFVSELSKLDPRATFLVLHKYRNAYGEIADHNIIFHMSYQNALSKSLSILEKLKVSGSDRITARKELMESFRTSLMSPETPEEMIVNPYRGFLDMGGKYIKGVKMHKETGEIYLYGLCHLKRVIVPGLYKERKSSQLTLAKNELRELCPVSKFRLFKILPTQVEKISVQKMSLLPPDTI